MLQSMIRCKSASAPITFVSSSTARTSSTGPGLAVTAPTGIQNGDLLLAFWYQNTTSATGLPTGFTSVFIETTSVPRVNIGWKIASGESGTYTFTGGTGSAGTAGIVVYRNAVYDRIGSIARGSSTTNVAAPSISPTSTGLLIAAFTGPNAASVSTAPTGMTQRLATGSDGVSTAQAIFVYDQEITATGATGTRSITLSVSGSPTGILLAIK